MMCFSATFDDGVDRGKIHNGQARPGHDNRHDVAAHRFIVMDDMMIEFDEGGHIVRVIEPNDEEVNNNELNKTVDDHVCCTFDSSNEDGGVPFGNELEPFANGIEPSADNNGSVYSSDGEESVYSTTEDDNTTVEFSFGEEATAFIKSPDPPAAYFSSDESIYSTDEVFVESLSEEEECNDDAFFESDEDPVYSTDEEHDDEEFIFDDEIEPSANEDSIYSNEEEPLTVDISSFDNKSISSFDNKDEPTALVTSSDSSLVTNFHYDGNVGVPPVIVKIHSHGNKAPVESSVSNTKTDNGTTVEAVNNKEEAPFEPSIGTVAAANGNNLFPVEEQFGNGFNIDGIAPKAGTLLKEGTMVEVALRTFEQPTIPADGHPTAPNIILTSYKKEELIIKPNIDTKDHCDDDPSILSSTGQYPCLLWEPPNSTIVESFQPPTILWILLLGSLGWGLLRGKISHNGIPTALKPGELPDPKIGEPLYQGKGSTSLIYHTIWPNVHHGPLLSIEGSKRGTIPPMSLWSSMAYYGYIKFCAYPPAWCSGNPY